MIGNRLGNIAFLLMFWILASYLAYSAFAVDQPGLAFVIAVLPVSSVLSWFGIHVPQWLVAPLLIVAIYAILGLVSNEGTSLVGLAYAGLAVYSIFHVSKWERTEQGGGRTMLNWNTVPERFHYLRNTVLDNRLGDLRVAYFDEVLRRHVRPGESITEEELPELARVYQEICQREDNFAILDWLDDASKAEEQPVRDAAWYIEGLLFLFHDLADLGVIPFSERVIIAEKQEPPLDWSTLPSELAYLAEAVEKYAGLHSEMAILEWLDQSNEEDIEELRELAQRMLRDEQKISEWSEKVENSPEEFHVSWLEMIFDHAGIEME